MTNSFTPGRVFSVKYALLNFMLLEFSLFFFISTSSALHGYWNKVRKYLFQLASTSRNDRPGFSPPSLFLCQRWWHCSQRWLTLVWELSQVPAHSIQPEGRGNRLCEGCVMSHCWLNDKHTAGDTMFLGCATNNRLMQTAHRMSLPPQTSSSSLSRLWHDIPGIKGPVLLTRWYSWTKREEQSWALLKTVHVSADEATLKTLLSEQTTRGNLMLFLFFRV